GSLYNLNRPVHGTATPLIVKANDESIFRGLPSSFPVGRYHSWAVAHEGFPDILRITAEDEQGVIMALAHKTLDVKGVQFHPESVLTQHGKAMIENWLTPNKNHTSLDVDQPSMIVNTQHQ